VTADDVLEVLARLDAAGIEWWVDGGWGVDALLGEETRPHDDLDVVVPRDDIARLADLFPEFARVDDEWWPARFVLRDDSGRQVDFHPVTFDELGDAWQDLVDGGRSRYPAEGLRGRGRIGRREVRCLTPELQVGHHDYEGPDDVDWDDVRVLSERFGLTPPAPVAQRPGFVEPKRKRARLRTSA
jgi:lincosamide nucleotidyltransferase A/C/D/E